VGEGVRGLKYLDLLHGSSITMWATERRLGRENRKSHLEGWTKSGMVLTNVEAEKGGAPYDRGGG